MKLRSATFTIGTKGQVGIAFTTSDWTCKSYFLRKDAQILGRMVVAGQCPLGILLDRLDDFPEEGGGSVKTVGAIVEYLRTTSLRA